ncbi:MAG TPA: hypothetical protein IAC21_06035 [Candidatus Enterenecus merdae]|nr:hypothetical protein [Candidatus Enterenecus merdae]
MKKRLLAFVLALSLAAGLLPAAQAVGGSGEGEARTGNTLTVGNTYWFDLSSLTIPGTVNTGFTGPVGSLSERTPPLPDQTLHWVPFTYAGEINAYVLNENAAGVSAASDAASATTDSTATYGYTYDHRVFVSEFNVTRSASWNDYHAAGLIFGTPYAYRGLNYTIRSMTGGSQVSSSVSGTPTTPTNNEWAVLMNMRAIKHYYTDYSAMQDSADFVTSGNGRMFHGAWRPFAAIWAASFTGYGNPINPEIAFRPVLEVPATTGEADFHVVSLDLNEGSLDVHEDYYYPYFNMSPIQSLDLVVMSGQAYEAPSVDQFSGPNADARFSHWEDENGDTYQPGDSVPASVHTLKAIWIYDVTYTLTQIAAATDRPTVAQHGESFSVTLSPVEGYVLDTSGIAVSMGGATVTGTVSIQADGSARVTIPAVTGQISITASASAQPPEVVGEPVRYGVASVTSQDGLTPGVPYTADLSGWFTDPQGGTLSYTARVDDGSGSVQVSGNILTYIPVLADVGRVAILTVTADNGLGQTDVTVRITVTQEADLSTANEITAFVIHGQIGISRIEHDAISDNEGIIEVVMPYGSDLSLLQPIITHNGVSMLPNSGIV